MGLLARALNSIGVGRQDSWANALTGLGGARDKISHHQLYADRVLTVSELEALYYSDDFAATIVDAPVEHAMMLGFAVAEDPDGAAIEALAKWSVAEHVTDAAIWGRLYGGAAVLIGVDNAGDPDEELDIEKIAEGSLQYLIVLDRQDLQIDSRYDDPRDSRYTQPRTYRVQRQNASGLQTQAVIHESRLVFFGGARTGERVRARNQYWDHSVLQRPYKILRDTDANWASVGHIMQSLSQAVFKVKGLISMIAEGDVDTMARRMAIVDMARSVARALVVDADSEDYSQVGAANVTGVSDIIEKNYQRLAAAARMPVTILMGMSPSGMNATGESDMRAWFNRLQVQRTELEPAIIHLADVVLRSEGVHSDGEPVIEWPSFWIMSPTEQAAYRKTIAETDAIYVADGVLLPEEVTVGRWGSGQYSPELDGVVDTDSREAAAEQEIKALLDPAPAPAPDDVPPAP